jgi:hypothetical protein
MIITMKSGKVHHVRLHEDENFAELANEILKGKLKYVHGFYIWGDLAINIDEIESMEKDI